MSANYKEQLSALMDGQLPSDETRFLLRRLDADQDLAQSWSNYQIASDVLKKQFATPLRGDFAAVVLQGIVVEKQSTTRGGLLRWAGGGAIAAAVAVFALTSTRPIDNRQPEPMVASTPPAQNAGRTDASTLPNFPAYDLTQSASFDPLDDRAPPMGVINMPMYSRINGNAGRVNEFGPYVLMAAPQRPVSSDSAAAQH